MLISKGRFELVLQSLDYATSLLTNYSQVPAQAEYDHGEEEVKCEQEEKSVCKKVPKQICHTEVTTELEPYTETEQKCEQVPHQVRHLTIHKSLIITFLFFINH